MPSIPPLVDKPAPSTTPAAEARHYLSAHIYRFRDALKRLGSIAAFSVDQRFLTVTTEFTELFGYSEAEVIDQPLDFLLYRQSMPALYERMWSCVASGYQWAGEIPCRHQNGQKMMVRLTIAPSCDEHGAVVGYVAQFQELQVDRHAELSDMFYRYRNGFSRLAALAIVSQHGDIQEINDLFTTLYGYARHEVIGAPIRLLRSERTPPSVYQDLWTTVQAGQVWTHEIMNRRKDGETIHVRATIAPAADNFHHAHDAFLVIYQDITAEVDARENKLQLAIESSRQEMLAGTLHNVGNLQQSVMGANETTTTTLEGLQKVLPTGRQHLSTLDAQLLACTDSSASMQCRQARDTFLNGFWGLLDQQLRQALEAQQHGRKALEATRGVLESFRDQQRNLRSVEEIDLRALINSLISNLSLQGKHVPITASISEMPADCRVTWPASRIQQILFNLLKNSKEAILECIYDSKVAHGWIDIGVRMDTTGDTLVLCIQDTGGGFKNPANMRFAHGVTSKAQGTGIGLHNACIMIESMEGSMSVDNILLHQMPGAAVTLCLPRHLKPIA